MPMIILDGQNNVGKSTLVDWVGATFGVPRFHHAETSDEMVFLREHLDTYAEPGSPLAIFDRFFFTYLVYPLTGNWAHGFDCPLTKGEVDEVVGRLSAANDAGQLLLVHARRDFDKLMAYEIGLNPEHAKARGDFLKLHAGFDRVFADWNPLIYNIDDPKSVEAVRQEVERFIRRHRGEELADLQAQRGHLELMRSVAARLVVVESRLDALEQGREVEPAATGKGEGEE